jgi:hypothetical protein
MRQPGTSATTASSTVQPSTTAFGARSEAIITKLLTSISGTS